MSWGERSCKAPCRMAIEQCNSATCNVDCPEYMWDGETRPDSERKQDLRTEWLPRPKNESVGHWLKRTKKKKKKYA